jgi:V/A-type H+-transporting ATPase subunit I
VLAILFLTPFLFFAGGLLAPLELLKSIGNIISYVRIAAIGLTSVLLAFVANNLAGLTGDVVTGVVVAGLIHLLNIVLGVFSPTIHSLRLHYVEFFSKFIEYGGKKFDPLKR